MSRLLPAESRPLAMTKRWEARWPITSSTPPWPSTWKNNADPPSRTRLDRAPVWQNAPWPGCHVSRSGRKTWCNGESYSLADIAVGCSLNYLDLRFAHMNWREQYPNLAALMAKLEARQSFHRHAAAASAGNLPARRPSGATGGLLWPLAAPRSQRLTKRSHPSPCCDFSRVW